MIKNNPIEKLTSMLGFAANMQNTKVYKTTGVPELSLTKKKNPYCDAIGV